MIVSSKELGDKDVIELCKKDKHKATCHILNVDEIGSKINEWLEGIIAELTE